MGLWAFTVIRMFNDFNNLSASSIGASISPELFGASSFLGGIRRHAVESGYGVAGERRWPARLWSIVLALSAFVVLWVAFAFHLFGFGVNY